MLLTAAGSPLIRLIDAFNGQPKLTLNVNANKSSSLEASFTPDSKYILSGSEEGEVHVWSAESGDKVFICNMFQ